MARTNIEIDDVLVEQTMRLKGARTKRQGVNTALRRLGDRGSLYRALHRLRGDLAWEATSMRGGPIGPGPHSDHHRGPWCARRPLSRWSPAGLEETRSS